MVTPIPVTQTRLRLLYGTSEVDVTESMLPDLIEFTYDDKETNEAEELTIKLRDTDGKWAGNWRPNGGEVIKAYIYEGDISQIKRALYCGKFYVDEIATSGPPRITEIRAVSIPLGKSLRRIELNFAWENEDLQSIAGRIAIGGGLELIYDSEKNPTYDRQEQNKESDLKFLARLCEDAGLSIKVTDEKLVIFDQASYEKKKPVKTLTLGDSNIETWSFSMQQSETYKTCKVSWSANPNSQHCFARIYMDPLVEENGQEYVVNQRVATEAEALELATATLHKLNARKATGEITVVGDVTLVAGVVIECKGFGKSDGNYIIEKASHTVGSGYRTALTLRRVNALY